MMRRIADVIELNVDSGLKDYYIQTGISQVQGFSMSKGSTDRNTCHTTVAFVEYIQEKDRRKKEKKRKENFWSYQYENIEGY